MPQAHGVYIAKHFPTHVLAPQTESSPASPPSTPVYQYGAYYFYNGMYEYAVASSMSAALTQSQPSLDTRPGSHSLIELAAELNPNSLSTVEVGWTVDQSVNGDTNPHLFIYHFVDGATSCYNGCGFVQVSKTRFPGMQVSVTSTPQDYAIEYSGGDWWVGYQDEWIGYFPGTLWPENYTTATLVQWYGEVSSPVQTSCSQMGDGVLGSLPGSAMVVSEQVNGAAANALLNNIFYSYYQPGSVTRQSFSLGGPGGCTAPLAASVLPGARSVQLGSTPTVFANMLNTGPFPLGNCTISLPSTAPAGLTMTYQTTNSATNAVTGTPNTPATLAAAPSGGFSAQTFVLSFSDTSALTKVGQALTFGCDGALPATVAPGVDTVDLVFSATPVPDIIALAATSKNDGIVHVPVGAQGAFAVATANIGVTGAINAVVDTGGATLPLTLQLCQTASDGHCLTSLSGNIVFGFNAGATPTFSVFVTAAGAIPLAPAASRIFVRFLDGNGISHGATSVAVTAQ